MYNFIYVIMEQLERGLRIDNRERLADILGFDKNFCGYFEIYKDGRIILHYIVSMNPNQGNVQMLIQQWFAMGFDVWVVRPNQIMQHICEKFHMSEYLYNVEGYGFDDVEVWHK
jgi:hypothetical protein